MGVFVYTARWPKADVPYKNFKKDLKAFVLLYYSIIKEHCSLCYLIKKKDNNNCEA